MSDHTFIAYVDESGCEGNQFGKGSSEFLVLAAVISYAGLPHILEDVFEEARLEAKKPTEWQFKKFNKLSDSHRHLLTTALSTKDVLAIAVIAHKPPLIDVRGLSRTSIRRLFGPFRKHGDLYFYLSKFLVERISWICRDHLHPFAPGNGTAHVMFSERQSLRYDDFRKYIKLLADNPRKHNSRVDWRFIRPEQISAAPHSDEVGLRVADIVASAVALAIEKKEHGMTDDRFARVMRPIFYRGPSGYLGNGIKLFPKKCETLADAEQRFSWIRFYYMK